MTGSTACLRLTQRLCGSVKVLKRPRWMISMKPCFHQLLLDLRRLDGFHP
jgi:hypothetical protein